MTGKHLSIPISTAAYYDELPIGTVLWWHKSFAARALTERGSGNNTDESIVRGNCEGDTSPMLKGETTPKTTNATWEKDTSTQYSGSNCRKFTIGSTGANAYVSFGDTYFSSNIHGLHLGDSYLYTTYIYIPSSVNLAGSKVALYIKECVNNAWNEYESYARNIYDRWQKVSLTRKIDSGATGVYLGIKTITGDTGKYFNVDAISLISMTDASYTIGDTAGLFNSEATTGDILYSPSTMEYATVTGITSNIKISIDKPKFGIDYKIYQKPSPPIGWAIIDGSTITDSNSPYYNMKMKDWVSNKYMIKSGLTAGSDNFELFEAANSNSRVLMDGVEGDDLTETFIGTQTEILGGGNFNNEFYPDAVEMVPILKIKTNSSYIQNFTGVTVATTSWMEVGDSLRVKNNFQISGQNLKTTNRILNGDDVLASTNELFQLNTVDLVSSKGRYPNEEINFEHFPTKLSVDGIPTYDNLWNKWNGIGTIGIFKATTNLVQSPEDLTNASWTDSASTQVMSDYYFQGKRFTKIISDGSGVKYNQVLQTPTLAATVYSFQWVFKIGVSPDASSTTSTRVTFNDSGTNTRLLIDVPWDKSTPTVTTGTLVSCKWYGDICEVTATATSCLTGVANALGIQMRTVNNNMTTSHYFYATAVQLEQSNFPTPYTASSRTAQGISYLYNQTSSGSIEFWFYNFIPFDSSASNEPGTIDAEPLIENLLVIGSPGVNGFMMRILRNATAAIREIHAQFYGGSTYTASWSNHGLTGSGWHHYKVAWTVGGTCSLIIDGAVRNSITWTNGVAGSGINLGFRTTPFTFARASGLFSDLCIWPTADTSITHYTKNRPYYNPNKILGENSEWEL